MKILEINKPNEGTGIFATFASNYPVEFGKIFGATTAKQLDLYAGIKYGSRALNENLTTDTWATYVDSVISVHVTQWVKQAELFALTYDILNPVVSKTQTDTDTTQTDTDNDTTTNNEKLFNDAEYNGREQTISERQQGREEKQSVSNTTSGYGSSHIFADVLQTEYTAKREQWQRNIIDELINEITLQIYD